MPDNQDLSPPLWTAAELAEATGGAWLNQLSVNWRADWIAFHMSAMRPGTFAIRTDSKSWSGRPRRLAGQDSLDTPTFLRKAAALGAVGALVQDESIDQPPVPLLRVPDTRQATWQLGIEARRRFTGKVIGITGTVGKTTTKSMLGYVLAKQGGANSTIGSRNTLNDVAVTLALTPRNLPYCVLEMAISSFFRVPELPASKIARLHVAIITSIGRGQVEDFRTEEDTASVKGRIFENMASDGVAIINHDTAMVDRLVETARKSAQRIIFYGTGPNVDVRLLDWELLSEGSKIKASVFGSPIEYLIPLPGTGMALNSLAALAATEALGADWKRAAADLRSFQPKERVLQRTTLKISGGDVEIIDDSHNAAQLSMESAFEVFGYARPRGGRRIAVLGSIVRLGDAAPELHAALAAPLLQSGVDKVLTTGEEMIYLRERLPESKLGPHADTPEQLAAAVLGEIKPGDIVLIKGSARETGFQKVADLILTAASHATARRRKQKLSKSELAFHLFDASMTAGTTFPDEPHRTGADSTEKTDGRAVPHFLPGGFGDHVGGLWSASHVAEMTRGRWLSLPPQGWTPKSVTYHMSSVKPGTFFVAMDISTWPGRPMRITGQANLSVSDRLSEVARLGASGAMIQSDLENIPHDLPLLRVANTRVALWQLAFDARSRFRGKVFALTGTVGKTTTKEMLRHVLSRHGPTLATLGSRNTIDDTAESLAMLPEGYSYAVLEMAVSSFHRVRRMPASKLARPHVAIITEVDAAHLKIYKTLERVVDQKTKIFDGLEPGGTAVLNRDSAVFDLLYAQACRRNPGRIITFGTDAAADFRLVQYEWTDGHARIAAQLDGREVFYRLPLMGLSMARNSLAALAATMASGADLQRAADDLGDFSPVGGRLEVVEVPVNGGLVTLIDDGYNANPASMRSGLAAMTLVKTATGGRRIVVLGEMKELGDQSERFHAELVPAVMEANVNLVFTTGNHMRYLRDGLPKGMLGPHVRSARLLSEIVRDELRAGDVVLIKGSHASNVHIVAKNLRQRELAQAEPRQTKRASGGEVVVVPDGDSGIKQHRPPKRAVASPAGVQKPLLVFAPLCEGRAVSSFDAIFVGDTSFGENYQQREEERGRENILMTRGYDYSLANFDPILTRANLVIANLETPITNIAQSPFVENKTYVHWTDVVEAPRSLRRHNIGVVSLANNHSTDFGEEGFAQTLKVLEENGIKYIGAGRAITEAERPFLGTVDILQPPSLKSHDFRLAVISAFHFSERYQNEYQAYASEISGGTNPLSESRMSRQIAEIKQAHPSVFVVVMPHWRRDYQWRSSAQAKFANRITAAGADLIIGHGAHMLQELEHVNGRWVVNGIGNFVFNSPGRYKAMNAPPYSLIVQLTVDFPGRLRKQLRLYPIFTDNRVTNYQPRFVTKSEFGEVQDLLRGRTNDRTRFDQEILSDFDHYGPYLSVPLTS